MQGHRHDSQPTGGKLAADKRGRRAAVQQHRLAVTEHLGHRGRDPALGLGPVQDAHAERQLLASHEQADGAAPNALCHAHPDNAVQIAADRHLGGTKAGCHLRDVEPPVALQHVDQGAEPRVGFHACQRTENVCVRTTGMCVSSGGGQQRPRSRSCQR